MAGAAELSFAPDRHGGTTTNAMSMSTLGRAPSALHAKVGELTLADDFLAGIRKGRSVPSARR